MGNRVTLHSACERGDLTEVHRILETGTTDELEAMDESGRTPLLLAVARLQHLYEYQELESDVDDLHGFADRKATDAAVTLTKKVQEQEDNQEEAQELEQEEAQEQEQVVNGSAESETVVTDDAELNGLYKDIEILHLLLQHRVNVDHTDENGWTALHHACFAQNAVAIKMLIHAGARPMRESYGLLPQDLLQRGHMSEWVAQAQELKESLDQIVDNSGYMIKLLAFRPSGIVQLDMGGQVEKGSFVTLEYDVPETHSVKDYIQLLISKEHSAAIETGPFHYVPEGGHGQLTISTKDIPSACTVRFVYVKSDINTMSREVVASGCNAVVQASVGEIFQYELYLYERVVEVESITEYEFIDQPSIVLKRIGIISGEDIEWVAIRPDNHIVAVNDIRIDAMDFVEAVRVLQENNGRQCTKLLMQNYSACGDFIPEKILGVGVVGKYAYLYPVDEDKEIEDDEQQYVAWMREETTREYSPSLVSSQVPQAETGVLVSKTTVDDDDDPATMDSKDTFSSSSTIETVVPLHNSLQLVAQLRHGILISHANR